MLPNRIFNFTILLGVALSLSACSKPNPAIEEAAERAAEAAVEESAVTPIYTAICGLDLSAQKRIFQALVRLEDITDSKDTDAKAEIARREKLSKGCVEEIARKGISMGADGKVAFPDWMPEPL